ncbi:MAG: PBP1A family penicillin-binding protein [Terriglobia bacterium]
MASISIHTSKEKIIRILIFLVLLFCSVALGAFAGLLIVYKSDLPEVRSLENYQPNVITELYSDDGRIIGTFALERRIIITYDQIPKLLRDALISAEDKNFETHWGIDLRGLARAAIKDLLAWKKKQGASTLTQQLSRRCFLTTEKSFKRKFQEFLFTIQIERHYSKSQILTFYCNQFFLGHGTYGFEAASQFYFSKNLKDLRLEEIALLAALPATAHLYSPINQPEKIKIRRDYVLDRMVDDGKITVADAERAKKAPMVLQISSRQNSLAPYFAEEIRKYLEQKYGSEAVNERGLRVYTTLNLEMQQAANLAVRQGLENFDKRHGWRGVSKNVLKLKGTTLQSFVHEDWKKPKVVGAQLTGLVLAVKPKLARVRFGDYEAQLSDADIKWTGRTSVSELLKPGDLALFRIKKIEPARKQLTVELDQRPEVQGALVAIDATNGEIKAMVGGYDFESSKFNRATQAYRQTGSAFKPFVYTMAVDQGMSPTDTIVDSPISYPSNQGVWTPQNYDHKFEGTITLRRALAQSRNIPAVKLLSKYGVDLGIDYVKKFGVTSPNLAPYLPLALGSAEITLLEMTSAYSVFPNAGVHILPRFIRRVTDYSGETREENLIDIKEVVSQKTSKMMVDLLEGVVEFGTAQKAKALQRPIAGKTGTTNNYTDAWFIGFTPSLTCGVWVGYDQKKPLGKGETGARAALPLWIDFMQQVLKNKPREEFTLVDSGKIVLPQPVDTDDKAAGDGETAPE